MKKYLLQIVIILSGGIFCCFFSIPAACILLLCGFLLMLIQSVSEQKQKRNILELCNKISEILNGKEEIQFDSFQEDEFSILSSEIQKMTVRLR